MKIETADIVKHAAQAVAVVLALGGGVLLDITPPEPLFPGIVAGVTTVLAVTLVLIVRATMKRPRRQRWLAASGALLAGAIGLFLLYLYLSFSYTFPYPREDSDTRYVAGLTYTELAEEYRAGKSLSKRELVGEFGGLDSREAIWTAGAIVAAKVLLTASYLAFVLMLLSSIFIVVEGLAARIAKKKRGRAPAFLEHKEEADPVRQAR